MQLGNRAAQDFSATESAAAEQGGADPHQRAAGGDGRFKIAGHAHREFVQRRGKARGEFVPQIAEIGERARGVGRGFGRSRPERRDRHQAVDPQVLFGERGFEQAGGVAGLRAEFRRVVPRVDLQQDRQNLAEFAGGTVEVIQELFAVDGLDAIEVLRGQPGLVGLQVAD